MPERNQKLESLLETARTRALGEGRRVLVSLSQQVESLDPLDALKQVATAAAAGGLDGVSAHRMYWTRRGERFALAGIGSAATFQYSGADRFNAVDAEFRALLQNAVTDGIPAGKRGVGALAMGGFSFAPEGPSSLAWDGFGSSQLFIPVCAVTSVDGETWLTISVVTNADGTSQVDSHTLSTLADTVGEARATPSFESEDSASSDVGFSETESDAHWRGIVREAVSKISSGKLHKVVLARSVRAEATESFDVYKLLRHLSTVHPDAFTFGFWNGDSAFFGASPERLARLESGEIAASSLAGTIERGATPAEDEANTLALRNSAKDRAEHAAVRDVLYSALADTCYDVVAPEEPVLLTLASVHHLHTPLRARLRPGKSLLDVVDHLHPTPAVGGTPRDVALRFIEEKEDLDRGWYAAPIGWIGRDSGEFAVALRSALVEGGDATLYAGCGIVADSDPDLELAESNLKLKTMASALAASLAEDSAEAIEMTVGSEQHD